MRIPSRRVVAVLSGVVVLAALFAVYTHNNVRTPIAEQSASPAASLQGVNSAGAHRGGSLVATVRSEPRHFNRLISTDQVSQFLSLLTQARLVRINQVTQRVEPWLADSWDTPDGQRFTLRLRPGITFSDGVPLTAADVVFTFAAVYDPKVNSPLAEAMKIGGKPIEVRAIDDHTVAVNFPAPYGPGVRILDAVPILPRHRLEAALAAGKFREAWSVTTTPSEIAGLGPFILTRYVAGQRVELERNPHYWRTDERGQQLPYLDRLTLEIVPDQSAEMLRLEAGQSDLSNNELRPDDVPAARKLASDGRLQLHDLGVGLDADFLWFNLTPKGSAHQAVDGAAAKPWMATREFRQAVSYAIDRQQFVNTVLLGAGTPIDGPVTPGNKDWYASDVPKYPHDPVKARALLTGLGATDRNHDGWLEAADGTPLQFTLLTQRGHALRERAAAVLKEDLAKIGVRADVSALEPTALIDHLMRGAYDAIYFGASASDTDPVSSLDFWLSSGQFHPWNPGQETPSTEWERQIDALMQQQLTTVDQAERKRLFAQVQRIFATEQPALYFAAPNVIVASSARLLNAQPALLKPPVLWAADALAVRP
jgi:peptide/nickel transport system substrate-binding protein